MRERYVSSKILSFSYVDGESSIMSVNASFLHHKVKQASASADCITCVHMCLCMCVQGHFASFAVLQGDLLIAVRGTMLYIGASLTRVKSPQLIWAELHGLDNGVSTAWHSLYMIYTHHEWWCF